MKVAIIGSGPAGLTCANNLINANKDIEVTVYDELKEFGGMIAYGIPQFRIPLSNIREQIDFAKTKGIKFVQKKVESIVELLGEFDKIVIAIGAGEGFSLGVPGEDNENVIDALEFLKKDKLEKIQLCNVGDVAIVGGGNAAIDAARVAKRQGANVTVLYRRTEKEMPAFGNELEEAKKEGIAFEFLKTPSEYVKENDKIKVICSIMKLGETDESGRARPVDTGEKTEMLFDKIILAIGQRNNLKWLEKDGIKTEWNNVIVTNYQTSLANVFACGDIIYGAKNIGTATLSGINCAKVILEKI
jgi:glutamate synthase (NADPH) small chain